MCVYTCSDLHRSLDICKVGNYIDDLYFANISCSAKKTLRCGIITKLGLLFDLNPKNAKYITQLVDIYTKYSYLINSLDQLVAGRERIGYTLALPVTEQCVALPYDNNEHPDMSLVTCNKTINV